eukprot:scpid39647/ scgid31854/ Mannosyl-oligosaccharide 1,2-alpha-mannosidase IB; Mannosidase alpha class 1A member 2; Processing alpha-1,2-mannosidase IB
MALLPLHSTNGKAGPGLGTRKVREKALLLFIFACFVLICFGALNFAPESWDKGNAGISLSSIQTSRPYHVEVLARPDQILARIRNHVKADVADVADVDSVTDAVTTSKATLKYLDIDVSSLDKSSPQYRRLFVKKMAQHAWRGYEKYAWGENELKPLSQRGHSASVFGATHMGATIVDSLDTLHIMEMTEEFERAKKWVTNELNFDQDAFVSTFEMTIRFVGGLLSTYALTKDEALKNKALEIAEKLLPAYNSPTGIAYSLVHLRRGEGKNWNWSPGKASILAEVGTMQLEMAYLTELTGRKEFHEKAHAAREALFKPDRPQGLFYNYISPENGNWGKKHVSLGALGDSFYEYLLKAWLQTNKQDTRAREMFDEAIEAIGKQLIARAENDPKKLVYLRELMNTRPLEKMDHLACFSGGMYALGSLGAPADKRDMYMQIGKNLTETCHESYDRAGAKLGPESFYFNGGAAAKGTVARQRYYIQRPEVIESYFYLWRLTKEQKYRDWGWEAAQAIEEHCRVENGYSGIKDIDSVPVTHDDVQQSFLLAETFKYLYLLFSEDDVLPLDQWVFNTEAHPLPVLRGLPSGA